MNEILNIAQLSAKIFKKASKQKECEEWVNWYINEHLENGFDYVIKYMKSKKLTRKDFRLARIIDIVSFIQHNKNYEQREKELKTLKGWMLDNFDRKTIVVSEIIKGILSFFTFNSNKERKEAEVWLNFYIYNPIKTPEEFITQKLKSFNNEIKESFATVIECWKWNNSPMPEISDKEFIKIKDKARIKAKITDETHIVIQNFNLYEILSESEYKAIDKEKDCNNQKSLTRKVYTAEPNERNTLEAAKKRAIEKAKFPCTTKLKTNKWYVIEYKKGLFTEIHEKALKKSHKIVLQVICRLVDGKDEFKESVIIYKKKTK